uniref:Roundabout, axon guidance receptor, homolog 2 (Drosophila) n=1 Tax=Salmo trutta TaxID=8032 RepID=A0A674A311_SALTR
SVLSLQSLLRRLTLPLSSPSFSSVLRDDFRQNPTDVVVAAGEPAILECIPPRGHPEPTTYWKKDKVRIEDKEDRITIRGGKLMISNTRKSDAGMFICVGTNMVGERDSETAQLTVFERPTFLRRPINQVVLEEEGVEFRCQVQGDPQPNVRWRKDDVDVPRGRYEIKYDKEDYLLRVRKASASDEGTFTCLAENRVGKVEASASLTVRAAPQFVIRPRDQIVAQGRTATFPCETKGNPQPAVFWQKEGSQNLLFPNQPQQPNSRFSVSSSGDLTISAVQRADAGYYICQALTVAGSILAKAQLEVTDVLTDRPPPIIRQGPSNQTLGVDSVALLKCQASGDPIPSISWLKDGVSLLGKDPRMSLQELGSLQMRSLRLSDSGIYTCVAASSSGETSWSAFLEVKAGVMVIKNRDDNELLGPPSKPQVTDVTKNSVSLSWQPGLTGATPISSFVIEAFSQSVSNSWQTVADHVKTTQYTVKGLRPNTIYLFMVRAVNTQGLSDPSPMSEPVRTQDISPPAQGVDHRHVQKELGEVIVRLHNPVVMSPTTIQVTWTVDRQSQFIQGYRVLYRQTSGLFSPGPWQTQDVKIPSERSVVFSNLKKGIIYEIKVRPYFNEFQGMDSESRSARTTEEAPSAPPLQVTVLMVGNQNSTSISISWDPPPPDHQNGIIQEYKIWCLGNETRFHVNKTVDAAIRSVVVGGLQVGVLYRVEVAASTSAGVGVKSEPQPIVIGKDFRDVIISGNRNNSITEQITDVVKQPAFIAGIGGACWVILMGFSIWLYWRRKKRKGLSNYAVTFQRVDGGLMSNGSRPGLLNAGDPGYPWLADSWPATSLPVNSGSGGPNDLSNFGRGGEISGPVLHNGDKTGTMLSDGAIYSSIDFTTKANYNSPSQGSQGATPYATTQILHSSSIHELAVDLPEAQWKASIQAKQEMANLGYSLPDKNSCNNSGKGGKKKKAKVGAKPTKANGSSWANVPLPPPPVHPLPGTEMDHYPNEHYEGGGYESDGWGPPMPVQTYLHQGMEDELEEEEERVPTPPMRGVASSPAAVSFGQQSTATLTPSPREELQPMLQAHLDEITRAYQLDMAKQTWYGGSLPPLPPQAPAPPVGYVSSTLVSDLETDIPDVDEEDEEEEEDDGYEMSRPLYGIEHTPGSSMDNLDSSVTGSMVNGWGSASEEDDRHYSSHRSSVGSSSDGSLYTHCSFAQALVAAADKAGYHLEGTSLAKRGKGLSHRPRPSSPFSTDGSTVGTHSLGHQRATRPTRKPRGQGTAPHRRDGCLPPYSKPSFPSPGGHSSSGTASSKGSTGPRKGEGPRGPHQWTATDHNDFLGTNGQGQYSGELCKYHTILSTVLLQEGIVMS